VALVTMLGAFAAKAGAQTVYWADINDSTINRVAAPGATPEVIVSNYGQPGGVVIDPIGSYLYFCDRRTDTPQKIVRTDLNGGNRLVVLAEPVQSGGGTQLIENLRLDLPQNWIYYTESNTRTIRRVHFDGTGDARVVQGSLNGPRDVALDIPGNRMYWVQGQGTFSQLFRARLDGSDQTLLFSDQGFYAGIEIDPAKGYVYFSDYYPGSSRIRRMNIDGSAPITLVDQSGSWPTGMDIDLGAGKLYWAKSDTAIPGIFRSNLDGSDVEAVATVSSDLSPWDAAVLTPEPANLAWLALAIASTRAGRARRAQASRSAAR
jgi:hypothetical protein